MSRRLQDEEGASLVLVIIFVMVFGLISAAILDFASTGFRTTSAIVELRDQQHAVQGAVDGAIASVRGSGTALADGTPDERCFELPESEDGDVEGVVVECEPVPPEGIVVDDAPPFAILALGPEGITQRGDAPLTVAGGIFSHGDIHAGAGASDEIVVFGDAFARGACAPEDRLTATGSKQCDIGPVHPDEAIEAMSQDPNLPPPVPNVKAQEQEGAPEDAVVFPIDPTPACVLGNTVVKFVPGIYTEHLQELVEEKLEAKGECVGAEDWWLSPGGPADAETGCPTGLGVYYFDFQDDEEVEDDATWVIGDDDRVVGGSLSTCDGGAPTAAVEWPTADEPDNRPCVEDGPGVQLIFGGTSRMHVAGDQAGMVAVCAGPDGTALTDQRIALYGLNTGSRTPSALEVREARSVAPAPPTKFENPDRARSVGGGAARATFVGGVSESASLTLTEFANIPPGSSIETARIQAVYTPSTPDGASVEVVLSWRDESGAETSCSEPDKGCDIMPQIAPENAPYDYRRFNDIASATLTATVKGLSPGLKCAPPAEDCTDVAPEEASIDVDAVILQVKYTPPGFSAHECPTSTPCALLSSSDDPVTIFDGTVYAPSARLDVAVGTAATTEFSRGVVVRTIDIDASSSPRHEDAPFSLPGRTQERTVLFTATVGGEPRLRALVAYTDIAPGNSRSYYGYRADVRRWVVLR